MLKRLYACVKEFKTAAWLTPLFILGEAIIECLIPYRIAMLINNLNTNGVALESIITDGLILAAMACASLLCGTLAAITAAKAGAGFARNLRHDMYECIEKYSFANIDRFSTSSLVTRQTTDVTNVQNSFQMIIRIAIRCPLMLVFAFTMTVRINPRIALIYLCVIPVLAVGLVLIITRVHALFTRVFRTYDQLNGVVQENLLGIRVVKSFVREEHEKEKFGAVSGALFRGFSRAEKLIAFNMPLMQLCVYTCMLLVSWIGARLVVGGDMTTGELTSLFNYTMQILMSLMMLSMVL